MSIDEHVTEKYENGRKYILYKGTGTWEPATIKECSSYGKQLEYCEAIKCPDCYYCVWASMAEPTGVKVKKVISGNTEHPLLNYITEKFNGRKE